MPRTAELFIAVNSKDRVSGTENKYTVTLPRLIRNVTMVELISAEIPNTLYPSQQKYLYFLLHVNTGYTTDTTIPATDVGGLYLCQAIVPEGVYSHGDAAVSLTQTMGVVKVYSVNKTMMDGTHLAANIVNEVNQTTDDIEIVPDSPDSAQSHGQVVDDEGVDETDPNVTLGDIMFAQGTGIINTEEITDFTNDPLAVAGQGV